MKFSQPLGLYFHHKEQARVIGLVFVGLLLDRVSSYRAGCLIVCVEVFKLAKPVKKHCRLSTIAGSSFGMVGITSLTFDLR